MKPDAQWFDQKDRAAELMTERADAIAQDQSSLQEKFRTAHRLYSDREWRYHSSSGGREAALRMLREVSQKQSLSLNIVKNLCDAATAQICQSRPLPAILTDGGDWEMQRAARKKDLGVNGVIHDQQGHIRGQGMARNGTIFGSGFLKVRREEGRVVLENVYTPSLLVDEWDGMYGRPGQMYQVSYEPVEKLKVKYPDAAKQLDKEDPNEKDRIVRVIDGWHVRADGKGHHAVVTDKTTLDFEPYKWAMPPFVKWDWSPGLLGYCGLGIPHEVKGIQFEINVLMRLIQENMWRGGNLKVAVQRGSKIIQSHLNNDLRAPVIEYDGQPPNFFAHDVVSNQIINHLQWLVAQGYNVTGISQLNAQSQTPGSSMSGKARLLINNSESQRFLTNTRLYDTAMTQDLGDRILEAIDDIHERWGQFEIRSASDNMRAVTSGDVIGDRKTYSIQTLSTTGLSKSISARVEEVDELTARGVYDKDEIAKLFRDFDARASLNKKLTPYDLINEQLNSILFEGEMNPPIEETDLELALSEVMVRIQQASMMKNVPEDRLQLLRDWRDIVLLQLAAEGAAAPQPIPGNPAAPLGAGAPPGLEAAPMAAAMPAMPMPGVAA